MKAILKTMAIIVMAAAAITACRNAGAHNEKKTVSKEKISAVIELTSDEFNSKVFDTQAEGTEYLGKLPAVIDFTASWCGICRKEMPYIESDIWQKHKNNKDFILVGIDREETAEKVVAALKDFNVETAITTTVGRKKI